MIDENCSHIVSNEGATDVEEIPVPTADNCRIWIEDFDEDGLEDFVAVEEEIVAKPSSSGADKAMPVMRHDQFERFDIVAGDTGLTLRQFQVSIGELEFVDTMVQEPESESKDEGKRNAECPLCAEFTVWGVSAAMENEEADDEDSLISQLTPSLHGKSEEDVASAMHSVG